MRIILRVKNNTRPKFQKTILDGERPNLLFVSLQFLVQSFHVHPIQSKLCGDSDPNVSEMMIYHWLIYNLKCFFLLLGMDQWDNTKHILNVHE
jgi:hypothetical protein